MNLYPTQKADHVSRSLLSPSALDLAGIAGLGVIIAIHTTELSGKIEETSYLGFGYVLLIAASLVSIVLLSVKDRRGWLLSGATAFATIVGFVLTRTTGLPGASGDIGNWGETIGIWSLIAEGLVLVLSLTSIIRERPVSRV
jgi:predicted membrane channel-forming protein YqfA (hemolysin III family)